MPALDFSVLYRSLLVGSELVYGRSECQGGTLSEAAELARPAVGPAQWLQQFGLSTLWLRTRIPGRGGSDDPASGHRSTPRPVGISGLCRVIAPIHKNEGMAKRVSVKFKNSDKNRSVNTVIQKRSGWNPSVIHF